MREQPEHFRVAARRSAPRATPLPRRCSSVRSLARSVRYAVSWISACSNRNSGCGQRRLWRTRSSRCSSCKDSPERSVAPSRPRAAAARTADRATTQPSARAGDGGAAGRAGRGSLSRPSAARRSRRRGRSASASPSRTRAPASTSESTSSSRKNGLPSAVRRRTALQLRRQRALSDERASSSIRVVRRAPRASSSCERCGYCRAAISFSAHERWSRSGAHGRGRRGWPRCSVSGSSCSSELDRGGVGPVQVLER